MIIKRERYTPTDIGPTPLEWEAPSLKEVSSLIANGFVGTATPYYTDETGVKYLYGTNVRENAIDLTGVRYVTKAFDEQESKTRLQEGDLLTVQSGHIGTTAVVPDTLERANCHALIVTRLHKDKVFPHFLSQYLNSHIGKARTRGLEVGSTILHINTKDLKQFRIPRPPFPEQQKIATILSTWDRAIELTEKLIAAKQKRKQALMQQLLTGKVRFEEFGEPWIRVPLGKLLKEVKRFVDWNDDAQYQLLSIRRRSGGMFDRETKRGHGIKTKVMMTTETGDFVIARMQAVHGAIAVTPPGCHGKHVSGSYSTFITKDPLKLHMPFLNYVSQTLAFYRLLLLSAYGVTIEKMTFNLPWFLSEKYRLTAHTGRAETNRQCVHSIRRGESTSPTATRTTKATEERSDAAASHGQSPGQSFESGGDTCLT